MNDMREKGKRLKGGGREKERARVCLNIDGINIFKKKKTVMREREREREKKR